MLKHAFLMLAHKQPVLIERIVSKIEKENHYIYIHYDAKSMDFEAVKMISVKYKNVYLPERKRTSWGGFSLTSCIIENFSNMIDISNNYDYFHLISGQDYPCVSMSKFDMFFEECSGKSFMRLDSEKETKENRKKKFKYRMENYFFNDEICNEFLGVKLYKIVNKLLKPIPRTYENMDTLWGGWNWYSLSRDTLIYLLNYIRKNPKYCDRFKHTICSDELIFATIVKNTDIDLNVDICNSLRFVEWNPKRQAESLPLLLTENELEDVVNSGAFFCRKVQLPESEKLLDKIDERIME